jgi:ketosteroid isomerase-like protein
MQAHPPTDEDRIRDARSLSNAAIAQQDIAAIVSFWTEAIHVTGSMGAHLCGPAENERFYREQFKRRPDTRYIRTPSTVQVMPPWQVGLECGDWVATWTDPDGAVQVTGRYMAQWLQVSGQWRIHGELYVPTSCTGGDYCARHPLQIAN